LLDQRRAAWSDVARRIAHEIKNPLTPIQLAAERLQRRYAAEVQSDPSTFERLTGTIVRQVGDLRRMVDEFSSFARMPAPVMRDEDLVDLVRQTVFLQRNARPEIRFELALPAAPVWRPIDARLVGQGLTNLLQNALDAIAGREPGADGAPPPQGLVEVELAVEGEGATITVADNGRGLPTGDRDRLTEPYVTTRAKGTGLGLAIVKKIMEDHGGELVLADNPGGGARVSMRFHAPTAIPQPRQAAHGS
jgi:two-component system nitrogen regulation sensor histidine kinase NtrY